MCGRFDFNVENSQELQRIVDYTKNKGSLKSGEVLPTDTVPVLFNESGRTATSLMKWGFPHFDKAGVIINARAETVLEKRFFRESTLKRRCIILTTGYYEWDQHYLGKDKPKYKFTVKEEPLLYMAGIYQRFSDDEDDSNRFAVVTTTANRWVSGVHNRMPVIVKGEDIDKWLVSDDFTDIFDCSEIELVRKQVEFPAQMSLFN